MSSTAIRRRLIALCAGLAVAFTGGSACQATLLNLVPAGSHTADITTSFTSAAYNSATDTFSIAGVPVAIDYNQIAPPDAAINSGGPGNPASYSINVLIDISGALIGPGTPTDLNIIGRIPGGPHPSPVYGPLLTGRAIAFGYSDTVPTRLFEFVFEVTGGSQAAQFGPMVGVVFDSISGFSGTFGGNFTTSITGNADNFAVPEPSAALLLAIGGAALGAVRLKRRRRLKR
jgi:hypothetical protein